MDLKIPSKLRDQEEIFCEIIKKLINKNSKCIEFQVH